MESVKVKFGIPEPKHGNNPGGHRHPGRGPYQRHEMIVSGRLRLFFSSFHFSSARKHFHQAQDV